MEWNIGVSISVSSYPVHGPLLADCSGSDAAADAAADAEATADAPVADPEGLGSEAAVSSDRDETTIITATARAASAVVMRPTPTALGWFLTKVLRRSMRPYPAVIVSLRSC
jgi:hypothetical protein